MNSLEFACDKLGVSTELVWSKRRDEKLIRQRRTIIWFYRLQGLSVVKIGANLDRSHSTILRLLAYVTEKEKKDAANILEDWLKKDTKPKYKFIKKVPDYLHSKTTYIEVEQ